jgi:hypothetical protein
MALLAFRVPGTDGQEAGEVTLSAAGGTLEENVNRWRRQMAQAPIGAAEIDALPRQPLLGRPAVRVDVRGDFTGMGQKEARRDWRVRGLVLPFAGRHLFVKFTGPAALVEQNLDAFQRFVASLRATDGGAPAAGARPSPPLSPEPAPRRGGLDPAKLAWDLPPGWRTAKPSRPFRVVDFRVDGAPDVEAYLSLLEGTGGGVEANVNIWRGQLGAGPLDAKAVDALERLDVLGTKAAFLEQQGDFQGMGGERVAGALFYGVIVLLQDDALFLRMVGPRAQVEPQRDAFRALARSLRLDA